MAKISALNYAALAQPLSQRSSKSYVGEVERRQTDRYIHSGVPNLSREDKHVPDIHPYNSPLREAWLAMPGEEKPLWDGQVTCSKSHHVCSTVGTWGQVLCAPSHRTLPGPPADEARGEWADSFPFLFAMKGSLLSPL